MPPPACPDGVVAALTDARIDWVELRLDVLDNTGRRDISITFAPSPMEEQVLKLVWQRWLDQVPPISSADPDELRR